jgi:hypothetical protein
MKRFFLLGLTALGLIALVASESKADGFRIYISPGYPQYRPYYFGDDRYRHCRHADEYRWQRWQRHHYDRDYQRDYDRD